MHVCQPWTNVPRYTTKPQTLRFSSHTSVLNFAGTALHVTPRMWANPSWTNVPRHTTKPQTLRFASHTSVLNFAGTALYIIPHMCAKPQTLRISSHTSLFWTFVGQLSILHHACVPTLNQCSKIHHKTSDPKIFISQICVELCRNSSPCSVFWMCQICKNLRARCLQGVVPRFIPDKFLGAKFFSE